MEQETYKPHDISPDGHSGIVATGFPADLPQEVVVYFPNGYTQEQQIEKTDAQTQKDVI